MVGDVPLIHDIILKDVLYVPQFCVNLLSVQRLFADNNLTMLFNHTHCLLQAPLMKKLLLLLTILLLATFLYMI